MPTITLTVPQKVVDGLQVMVDRYNASHGTTLTIKQWIILQYKRQIIGADMATFRASREPELETAKMDQLIADESAEEARLMGALE